METKDVTVKIYLPSDIRARFKAKCALEEKSMNEVLLEFIQGFIEGEGEAEANGARKKEKTHE